MSAKKSLCDGRKPRAEVERGLYHIITRGNDRQVSDTEAAQLFCRRFTDKHTVLCAPTNTKNAAFIATKKALDNLRNPPV